MTFKRLSSLAVFAGLVLFSYAAANAQQTAPSTPTSTTPTSTNSRVVITDNLAKPATPAPTTATTTTTSQKIGNFSVNVTEGVKGQTMENGKFVTMTKWDGTKWVTKREWVTVSAPATKPNPQ